MPSSRTAAYVDALGPVDAIRVGTLPVPELGPDDVLVAVDAVAANPVDTYVRSGQYATPIPLPLILGRDLVGTVVEVGAGVQSWRPGDAVWGNSLGHDGRQGSFTDFAVVAADRLYRVPDGVDVETVVAVAHPAITAYLGWFVHARIRPEMTVFIGGGAGNVGTAAIQLARRAGVRVIASAREEHADRCRAAGADVVVDYRSADLAEQVRAAAPDGVDVLWDTSGTNDFGVATAVLAPGATILVTASRQPTTPVSFAPLYTRDTRVLGFVVSRAAVGDLARGAQLINQLLADGALTARIADRLPLSAAAAAHTRLESGDVDGRLVLRPSGTSGTP